MAPPQNGNEYIPFREVIALERMGANTFRSTALAFAPANQERTYGGHVYMQACYAAAQTVPKGHVLHNVTGWFLLAGKAKEKFIYTVRTIKDGGYCTRGVDVIQESDPANCFTCVCSFKKPEKSTAARLDVQQQMDLRKQFESVLGDMEPEDHPEMPGMDAPWYWEWSKQNGGFVDPFPGLKLRKVDTTKYNKNVPALEHRDLKYYSIIGSMPLIDDDPNMHACAHLYASDRNSMFTISNHLGVGNNYQAMASLSHTVIFQCDAPEMDMIDERNGEARWFCQEAWPGGSRHGRGLHQSRMWREDGLHVATTVQDGMVRLKTEGAPGKPGFSPVSNDEMTGRGKRKGKL